MTAPADAPPAGRAAIWALLLGNLVIGTGVQLPIGLLDLIAADLDVTVTRAGLIVFAGGLVVGVGAPLLAWATSRIDRRKLLTGALLVYAAGHAATALLGALEPMLAVRVLTMTGAALFTPQAASAVGLLVPPERRAATVALIFVGWSAASVVGLPLGRLLGTAIGWQGAFLCMAAAAAAGAALVWRGLPGGLRTEPLSLASWGTVFTNPALLAVLTVSLLTVSGQFTIFSYAAPLLGTAFGAGAGQVALAFAAIGAAGVTGNFIASRVVPRLGIAPTIHVAISLILTGLVIVGLGWGHLWAFVLGGMTWGVGTFSSNSMQQSRLIALSPALAGATVALNTSAVYLAQSVGSTAGGLALAAGAPERMPWIGAGFVMAALAISLAVARLRPIRA